MVDHFKIEENIEEPKTPVSRVSSCYLSENDISPQANKVIRLALLGDANCGKSKLIQTMQQEERLEEENSMTTLDLYRGKISINGVLYELEIVDLGGDQIMVERLSCFMI